MPNGQPVSEQHPDTQIDENHYYTRYVICQDCESELKGSGDEREKSFKEALEQGRRIVVIKDAGLSADAIGKRIESCSKIAEKFGYTYKSETHLPDSIGISLSIIFEKVIPTTNETKFVNCQYCKTRYDANQYFKCPQCGSPSA